jgi:hypothetical protein
MKKLILFIFQLFFGMKHIAGQLSLNGKEIWHTKPIEVDLGGFEGKIASGIPNGQGVGCFNGSLELCIKEKEEVEKDEDDEIGVELLEGLCLEASWVVVLYGGEWKKVFPGKASLFGA